MSAPRMTPGPWHWQGNTLAPVNPNPYTHAVHSILDAEGGFGFVGSDNRQTLAELDVDRAVIAAAPMLLRRLRELYAAAQWAEVSPAMRRECKLFANCMEEAKFILSKFEGIES